MRPNDGRAIPTFLRQALTDKPVTVFGDGSQTRSFCYVDDLIRGLVLLSESGVHDPVNIGNPNEMSLLDMAKLCVEMTESRSEIVFEALPVDDPQVRQPDISRARDLLGWEPAASLRDGPRVTIDHLVKRRRSALAAGCSGAAAWAVPFRPHWPAGMAWGPPLCWRSGLPLHRRPAPPPGTPGTVTTRASARPQPAACCWSAATTGWMAAS